MATSDFWDISKPTTLYDAETAERYCKYNFEEKCKRCQKYSPISTRFDCYFYKNEGPQKDRPMYSLECLSYKKGVVNYLFDNDAEITL
jgi:hypothetical protein